MNHPLPDVATSAEKLLLWLPDGLKAAARPSLAYFLSVLGESELPASPGSATVKLATILPGLWGAAGQKTSLMKTGQGWRVGSEFAC